MGKTTMTVRTPEQIKQSMIERGLINGDGTAKLANVVKNATTTTEKSKAVLAKTSKSKKSKTKRTAKNILNLEGVSFSEKEQMFDAAMSRYFGDAYNAQKGTVKTRYTKNDKPLYVNVQIQEMKVRTEKSKDSSGLRVYMFKNANSYTIGEYAGKLSISRIAKRIDVIAKSELSA